jgi:hypothetical protein
MRKLLALAALFFAVSPVAMAQQKTEVDLALVLAVDCSGSVDRREFDLQLNGIATAISDPDVLNAITSGRHGRIAVNLLLWADPDEPKLASQWMLIEDQATAAHVASEVRGSNVRIGGGTGIGVAIGYAISVLRSSLFAASRQVIDVSGDGRESWELREPRFKLPAAKALAAASGITVNGLAIQNDVPNLADYYTQQMITGPNAFVISVNSYEQFGDAMKRKLLREILPPSAQHHLQQQPRTWYASTKEERQ